MDERIQALRKEVDRVNREILRLLSERGRLVQEIGRLQTELGLPHYDPKREEEMLAYLTAENPGPFPDETIRKLFKEIFKASLDPRSARTRRSSSTPKTQTRAHPGAGQGRGLRGEAPPHRRALLH